MTVPRARHRFRDLRLEIRGEGGELLEGLLAELSWEPTDETAGGSGLSLVIDRLDGGVERPAGRVSFRADGFVGLENDQGSYLSDGSSVVHFDLPAGIARARLAAGFPDLPPARRRSFWAYTVLKLLRGAGCFAVHAAALVTPAGHGVLLVGGSGSGKSTLALALVRRGSGFLSDDTVLLRDSEQVPDAVEALGARRHFGVLDAGGDKRVVPVEELFPDQRVERCRPAVLLFPRVVPGEPTVTRRLEPAEVVRRLLTQSGSQLFERATMPRQMDLLGRLSAQAAAFELRAGADLYGESDGLASLVHTIETVDRGADHHRADQ